MTGEAAHLQRRIAILTARLAEIEQSPAWRLLLGVRSVLDRLAPLGTARRRFLDRAVLSVRRRSQRRSPGRSDTPSHSPPGCEAGTSMGQLLPFLRLKLSLFLGSTSARISFPHADDPLVSILLVTFNRAEYTLECLESIRANSDASFEVVIVDNASTDATADLLARLDGATIIRNAGNEGFLLASNKGASVARGRWLLFLNNDTQPLPGYLSRLLEAGELSTCGAVGSCLVLPDGRLQEAGSIVWRDGSCVGYGRGGDPAAPEHTFAREVDYCSGACLLVRRDLFERAGGFDTRYAPAYYEEADLAMVLRELGFSVRYQPASVVIHYEFGSAASSASVLELQGRNRAAFAAKWERQLRDHLEASSAGAPLAARDARRSARRILVVDDRVPDPALGTGYPRSHALLESLVELGQLVTFFPFLDGSRPEPVTRELASAGVEVMHGHDRRDFADFLAARRGHYDLIWVSRPHNMREAISTIRSLSPGTPVIYDAEALFAARLALQCRIEGRPLTPNQERQAVAAEAGIGAGADAVVTVSARELEQFRPFLRPGQPTAVLCHPCTPAPTATGFGLRHDLLFVGAVLNADSPNLDTIRVLAREVLPRVRREVPVRLMIAGTVMLEEVLALASPEIVVTGQVPDLGPWYDRCRLFVAPTRYAAGIPLKLLEAFANGIPAVISPLLAAQLGIDESVALVAGDPEEFARKVVRAYRDEELWGRLRRGALDYVGRTFSPTAFRESLASLLAQFARAR